MEVFHNRNSKYFDCVVIFVLFLQFFISFRSYFFEIYSLCIILIPQTNPALNIADPATNATGSGWFPILLVFVFDLFDMAGRALPNFTRWVPLLSTRALFIGTSDFLNL